jgi:hypothetical protein
VYQYLEGEYRRKAANKLEKEHPMRLEDCQEIAITEQTIPKDIKAGVKLTD